VIDVFAGDRREDANFLILILEDLQRQLSSEETHNDHLQHRHGGTIIISNLNQKGPNPFVNL
jgi:hypothetical protein